MINYGFEEKSHKRPIGLIIIAFALVLAIAFVLYLNLRSVFVNYNVTDVALSPLYLNLEIGSAEPLKVQVTTNDGSIQKATCSSNNLEVAVVDSDTCLVYAVNVGSAEILAISEDGSHFASTKVNVKEKFPELTGLKLDEKIYNLAVGEMKLIGVSPISSEAKIEGLVYIVADESIAKIDNGVLKGIKSGKTTLTVRSNDGRLATMAQINVSDTEKESCKVYERLENGKCVPEVISFKPTKINLKDSKVEINIDEVYAVFYEVVPYNAISNVTCETESKIVSTDNCLLKGLAKGTTIVKVCSKIDLNVCSELEVIVKKKNKVNSNATSEVTINQEKNTMIVGNAYVKIIPMVLSGGSNWNREGGFYIEVQGDTTGMVITYDTFDETNKSNNFSGPLSKGTKAIYFKDTIGTVDIKITIKYKNEEYFLTQTLKAIDSKPPTCQDVFYDEKTRSISVSALDETSGLKNAVVAGRIVYFSEDDLAHYYIDTPGVYNVVIYDAAGNDTNCGSVNVKKMDRKVEVNTFTTPTKIEANLKEMTLNLGETKVFKAWALYSDNTKRRVTYCQSTEVECVIVGSDSDLKSSSSYILVKGIMPTEGASVIVGAEGFGDVEIKVKVGNSLKPTISYAKSTSLKKGLSYTIRGEAQNRGEELTQICFGTSNIESTCNPSDCTFVKGMKASATFGYNLGENFVSNYNVCASIETSSGLKSYFNYEDIGDSENPSCELRKYGSRYQVVATDAGVGIRYLIQNGVKYEYTDVVDRVSIITNNTNVTAVDWANNESKCEGFKKNEEPTKIAITCNDAFLEETIEKNCLAIVEPASADQKVSWSTDSSYISIDDMGIIRPLKENNTNATIPATIKATTANNLSATQVIMLSPSNSKGERSSQIPICNISAYPSNILEIGASTTISVSCLANAEYFRRNKDISVFNIIGNRNVIDVKAVSCDDCSGESYFLQNYAITALKEGNITITVPEGLFKSPSGTLSSGANLTIKVVKSESKAVPVVAFESTPNNKWFKEGKVKLTFIDDKSGYKVNFSTGLTDSFVANNETETYTVKVTEKGSITLAGTITDIDNHVTNFSQSFTFAKIDNTAPTCDIKVTTVKDGYQLTATASDDESGLSDSEIVGWTLNKQSYTKKVSSAGNYTFEISDKVGNIGTCSVTAVDFPNRSQKAAITILTSEEATATINNNLDSVILIKVVDDKPGFKTNISCEPDCRFYLINGETGITNYEVYEYIIPKSGIYNINVSVTDVDGLVTNLNRKIKIDSVIKAPICMVVSSKNTINIGEETQIKFTCTIPNESDGSLEKGTGMIEIGSNIVTESAELITPQEKEVEVIVPVKGNKIGSAMVRLPAGAYKNGEKLSNEVITSISVVGKEEFAIHCNPEITERYVTVGGNISLKFSCELEGKIPIEFAYNKNAYIKSNVIMDGTATIVNAASDENGDIKVTIKPSMVGEVYVGLKSGVYSYEDVKSSKTAMIKVIAVAKPSVNFEISTLSSDKTKSNFNFIISGILPGNHSKFNASSSLSCQGFFNATSYVGNCETKQNGNYSLTVTVDDINGKNVLSNVKKYVVTGIK